MNSHQFSLVLLNIIAESGFFGLETIEFSRGFFLSCMSNQTSSVRSIYLPPLNYRNFSIFMIEVCKKNHKIMDLGTRQHTGTCPTSTCRSNMAPNFTSDNFLGYAFVILYMSRFVGKPTMWFLIMSDTNRAAQAQKNSRCLEFRI